MINHCITLLYSTEWNIYNVEEFLCASLSNSSAMIDGGYDQFCYNITRRLLTTIPIILLIYVIARKNAFTAYRIDDGFNDCVDQMDENTEELVVNVLIYHFSQQQQS
jgi:hypothetical protein